jgi:hypothetical protein
MYGAIDDAPGAYEFIFAYGPQSGGYPASATIGVEDQLGAKATKYLYGAPSAVVTSGRNVCFDYQGPNFAPVTITYEVTVNANASGTLVNNAVHNTNNPGSQPVTTSVMNVVAPILTPGVLYSGTTVGVQNKIQTYTKGTETVTNETSMERFHQFYLPIPGVITME